MEIKTSEIMRPIAQHIEGQRQIPIAHIFYFKNSLEIFFGPLEEFGLLFCFLLQLCSVSLPTCVYSGFCISTITIFLGCL